MKRLFAVVAFGAMALIGCMRQGYVTNRAPNDNLDATGNGGLDSSNASVGGSSGDAPVAAGGASAGDATGDIPFVDGGGDSGGHGGSTDDAGGSSFGGDGVGGSSGDAPVATGGASAGGATGGAPSVDASGSSGGSGGFTSDAGAGSGGTGAGGDSGDARVATDRASEGGATGGVPGVDGGGSGGSGGSTSNAGGSGSGGNGSTGGSSGSGGSMPTGCSPVSFSSESYVACSTPNTFDGAETTCQSMGMRVVRIDNGPENNWAASVVQNGWIGATDIAVKGEWRWMDGTLFWLGDKNGTAQGGLYTAWSVNEPSANPSTANCARFDSSGKVWVDVFCTDSYPFVCEPY
jgi:hypothetical protein